MTTLLDSKRRSTVWFQFVDTLQRRYSLRYLEMLLPIYALSNKFLWYLTSEFSWLGNNCLLTYNIKITIILQQNTSVVLDDQIITIHSAMSSNLISNTFKRLLLPNTAFNLAQLACWTAAEKNRIRIVWQIYTYVF